MFPARIATRSQSLLDQIFCEVPCKEKADISASLLLSGISDHFPCVVNLKILNKRPVSPKQVYQRTVTESSLDQYRTDLPSLNIDTHLEADLMTDPNESYQIFEKLIQTSYQWHFPKKNVLNLTSINTKYQIGLRRGYLSPSNIGIIYIKANGNGSSTGINFGTLVVSYIYERYTYCQW